MIIVLKHVESMCGLCNYPTFDVCLHGAYFGNFNACEYLGLTAASEALAILSSQPGVDFSVSLCFPVWYRK